MHGDRLTRNDPTTILGWNDPTEAGPFERLAI